MVFDLDRVVKNYLEAKFGLTLDYFAIEGRMSPDEDGNIGVTGNYRKKTGDKKVFFTLTVNSQSSAISNLQEYA